GADECHNRLPLLRAADGSASGKSSLIRSLVRQTSRSMSQQRMHADEVVIDADLVRRLILSQHPQWADLAIEPVASTGTVNAIWRLGTDMYVRLPRVQAWAGDLENELRWLPVLAPQLSLDVPNPIAAGEPQFEYPFRWAIFSWHEGETFVPGNVDDCQAAADLAQFVA